jgi:hypothetical protein
MRHWLHLSSYHAVVLFLAMAACGAMFTYNSYRLFEVGVANARFIAAYGWLALVEGGFRQLVEIGISGLIALLFYLGFKACEVELVYRWRNWR